MGDVIPLRGKIRYRSKAISKTYYLRFAFRGNRLVEVKKMRYRR